MSALSRSRKDSAPSSTPSEQAHAGSSHSALQDEKNAEHTVSFTAEEIRDRLAKGEWKSETNWQLLDSMSEEELERRIAEDPDADVPGIDWDNPEIFVAGVKIPISIRLDPDVLDFFKAAGAGYQKRINAVLRSYMTHTLKRRAKKHAAE